MEKESVFMAFMAGFAIYLDIVINIILFNSNEMHSMGDFFWFMIVVIIFIFYLICFFKQTLLINIITYIISFVPLILLVFYLINLEPMYVDSDWKIKVSYIGSEIFLLAPAYFLQFKKIIKIYKSEI